MSDKKKEGYKSGDVGANASIDLDKYTFKNSDVVKWTKPNIKKRTGVAAKAIQGLATLGKRSRFRKG